MAEEKKPGYVPPEGEEPQGLPASGNLASGLENSEETQLQPTPAKETETSPEPSSFLSSVVGETGFATTETTLDGAEKEQGVSLDREGDGFELVFDEERLNTVEEKLIAEFMRIYREGGKDALMNSEKFKWFFDEEDDEFLDKLAELLEVRIQELRAGRKSSSLKSQGINQKLMDAVEFFREKGKRETLRTTLDQQVKRLPFSAFKGYRPDGSSRVLKFNPDNIFDPTNEVDFIYVNNPSGKPELVITCKVNNEFTSIKPVFDLEENVTSDRKFKIRDGGVKKNVDTDDSDGFDYTSYDIELERGTAPVDPIFAQVKILVNPINLDQELDKMLAERKRKQDELDQRRRAATPTYTPTPPSVPSSNRFTQPTTHIRTSG